MAEFIKVFQSTRPARGATFDGIGGFPLVFISIHAPREGRDAVGLTNYSYSHISIHAPREGRDVFPSFVCAIISQFQSTRPARGATKRI